MPLTVDTAPNVEPCAHCRQTFGSSRALRRHVALDHVADDSSLEIVAALTAARPRDAQPLDAQPRDAGPAVPRAPAGGRGAAGPGAASATTPRPPATQPSLAGWPAGRVCAQIAIALYGLLVLAAVSPVLASVLTLAAAVVLGRVLRARGGLDPGAAGRRPPAAPDEPPTPRA